MDQVIFTEWHDIHMSTISTYLQTPTLTLTANPCQLIHISHQHCTAFTVRVHVRVRASNTKPLSTHTYLTSTLYSIHCTCTCTCFTHQTLVNSYISHINIVQHSLYVYVYVLQTPNPCQLIHIYTSALYSIHCTCTCTCFKHQTLVNSYTSHQIYPQLLVTRHW